MEELTKPQVEFTSSTITYDFTQLDSQIDMVEKTINSVELKEENIDEIKAYNTSLNKLANALNDDKKKIEANIAPGLKEFKDACMQRVNRLKAIRETTKSFVDDVEIIRKENKKAEIKEFFETLDNACVVPFELCMRDEFLNKSCSTKKWKSDLSLNKELLEKEYKRLDDVNVDDIELLKKLFADCWDYGKARDEYDRIKSLIEEKTEIHEGVKGKMPTQEPVTEQATIMLCISGDVSICKKAIDFARDLGLSVEVV